MWCEGVCDVWVYVCMYIIIICICISNICTVHVCVCVYAFTRVFDKFWSMGQIGSTMVSLYAIENTSWAN